MTSRKSKKLISRDFAIEAINELLKQREEVIEQLHTIEKTEKDIRTKLSKLEEYIAFLRPITEASDIGSLEKIPNDIFTTIVDILDPKSIVNLRATSRSIRNKVSLSAKTQAAIDQKHLENERRIGTQNINRRLDDIVEEEKAKRLSKQAQQKLNAEKAAHLKQVESEIRKYVQQLSQAKIREQRVVRKSIGHDNRVD